MCQLKVTKYILNNILCLVRTGLTVSHLINENTQDAVRESRRKGKNKVIEENAKR